MGPLKTTVVWYPHTERPTGPMLCQIALDLGESDSTDFPRIVVLEERYEWRPDRQRFVNIKGISLQSERFFWTDIVGVADAFENELIAEGR